MGLLLKIAQGYTSDVDAASHCNLSVSLGLKKKHKDFVQQVCLTRNFSLNVFDQLVQSYKKKKKKLYVCVYIKKDIHFTHNLYLFDNLPENEAGEAYGDY